MGYDISAYVEKKNKDTSKWDLVTTNAVSSRLKHIFNDYRDFRQIGWDDLSTGMQEHYKKDEEGNVWCNFYVVTLQELEGITNRRINDVFTKLNVIVKALGCSKVFSDEGEELEPWGDDDGKLTYPINKQLVEDLQYGYESMREIGQREAFDLFIHESMDDYDGEYRIILVVA